MRSDLLEGHDGYAFIDYGCVSTEHRAASSKGLASNLMPDRTKASGDVHRGDIPVIGSVLMFSYFGSVVLRLGLAPSSLVGLDIAADGIVHRILHNFSRLMLDAV